MYILGFLVLVLSQETINTAPAEIKVASEKRIACENRDLFLNCGQKKLSITSAMYGRKDKELCTDNNPNKICESQPSVLVNVKRSCDGKNTCTIEVINSKLGGDPCPGTGKYLEVDYQCIEAKPEEPTVVDFTKMEAITKHECEHKLLHLSCPKGGEIEILTAEYGGTSTDQCTLDTAKISLDCQVGLVLDTMKLKCDHRQNCYVKVEDEVFNSKNLCKQPSKYLKVIYSCNRRDPEVEVQSKIACENQELELDCKDDLLWLTNVMYGNRGPVSDCRNIQKPKKDCESTTALNEMSIRCHSLKKCTVKVENSVLGTDPCPGTGKYLEVDYLCLPENPIIKHLSGKEEKGAD